VEQCHLYLIFEMKRAVAVMMGVVARAIMVLALVGLLVAEKVSIVAEMAAATEAMAMAVVDRKVMVAVVGYCSADSKNSVRLSLSALVRSNRHHSTVFETTVPVVAQRAAMVVGYCSANSKSSARLRLPASV
jgi:hypothetical protein